MWLPGKSRIRRVLARARAWLSRSVVVLMYHRIAEVTRDPWELAVAPGHFAEHLEVARRYGQLLTVREVTRMLAAGRVPHRGIVVTLDDGYADNLLQARPLLERHGVPATVFIAAACLGRHEGFWWDQLERFVLEPVDVPQRLCLEVGGRVHEHDLATDSRYPAPAQETHARWRAVADTPTTERHRLFLLLYRLLRPLGDLERQRVLGHLAAWSGMPRSGASNARPLTHSEVRALAADDLVEIGAHALTHPQLSACARDVQWAEIRGSRQTLEETIGREVVSFAYPYGSVSDYTRETVSLVANAGFSGACVTVPGAVRPTTDCFELPRFHVTDCDGDEFARRLAAWEAC